MGISKRHVLLKEQAIKLRQLGQSYGQISDSLGLAKSTLNGWLKNVEITSEQKQKLIEQWKLGMRKAQERSCQIKKEIKIENIRQSHTHAKEFLQNIPLNKPILELFLAGLYLGDGFKANGRLGLGNANPEIVRLFITLIRKLYSVKESKLRAEIFGRADQDPHLLVKYWSNLLKIPMSQFHHTQLDNRTVKPTRSNYHGVCAVSYGDVNLQRRILAIGDEMLKCTNNQGG